MSELEKNYNHLEIEKKWQEHWLNNKTYKSEIKNDKEKYYVMDMFPYPSGSGLHVGHPLGYIASDIISRYKKLKGFNVLHPMGWDSFGLPAENAAIKTGTHPRIHTKENIEKLSASLRRIGATYDLRRSFSSHDDLSLIHI